MVCVCVVAEWRMVRVVLCSNALGGFGARALATRVRIHK